MIDTDSLREHIRFSIEHYGTKTQGESHRFDQVASYLTELIIRIQDYQFAMAHVADQHGNNIAASFRLMIK